MAKPVLVDIAHGVESWDSVLNDNLGILRDNPMPVKEHANAVALPAASSFDRCIGFKEITAGANPGWLLAYSDGAAWRYLSDEFVPMGNKSNDNFAKVMGKAYANFTPVGNVGTGEDDLMSYALPASALNANLRTIKVRAWGTTANNANAKTLKLHFGSAVILTKSLTISVAGVWVLEATIGRVGSNSQRASAFLLEHGQTPHAEQSAPTQADSGAITIKVTGQGTADNDIQQMGMKIEYAG